VRTFAVLGSTQVHDGDRLVELGGPLPRRLLTALVRVLGKIPAGSLTPHATLEAAIGWSVDLLPDAERSMLLRLWPFEGGFPLEAVLSQEAGLETLSSLVSRSMVVADTATAPARYRLLEIIRAYCRAHDPAPEASAAAHAAFIRRLAAQAAQELRGERSPRAIATLTRELQPSQSSRTGRAIMAACRTTDGRPRPARCPAPEGPPPRAPTR
jgi:predicted ATPase